MFCYCLKFEHIVLGEAVNCATIAEFLIRIARYSIAQLRMKINPKGAFRGSTLSTKAARACDVGLFSLCADFCHNTRNRIKC